MACAWRAEVSRSVGKYEYRVEIAGRNLLAWLMRDAPQIVSVFKEKYHDRSS
jgi:hypothetical protein